MTNKVLTREPSELLPCPMCASIATDHEGLGEFWVRCIGCGLSTKMFTRLTDAEAAWNTRAMFDAAPEAPEGGEGVYSYIPMPLDADGNGPADPDRTVRIQHEVWNLIDNSTVCVAKDEATARLIASALSAPAPAKGVETPHVDDLNDPILHDLAAVERVCRGGCYECSTPLVGPFCPKCCAGEVIGSEHAPAKGEGAGRLGRYIKLVPDDEETNAVICPERPEDGCYWTLIGAGAEQNRQAEHIVAAINAYVGTPAPSLSREEIARVLVDDANRHLLRDIADADPAHAIIAADRLAALLSKPGA